MRTHRWILALIVAMAVLIGSADQGMCASKLSQEERVQRIVDAYQIENIAATFEIWNYIHYYIDEFEQLWIDKPDTRMELAPTGATIGLGKLMKALATTDRAKVPQGEIRGFGTVSEATPNFGEHGEMHIHEINGSVIEIARDNKTARIMFNSTGKEGSDWAWVKYGVDLIRDEEGEWKIWHYSVFGTTNNSYFVDWADMKGYMGDPGVEMTMMMPGAGEAGGMPGGGGPGGDMAGGGPGGMPEDMMAGAEMQMQQNDRAAKYRWVYTGGNSELYSTIPPLYPIPPEPYDTWDDIEISY